MSFAGCRVRSSSSVIKMERLVNNKEDSDVHFIIEDGETIYAHKHLLEQKSPYFRNHWKDLPHHHQRNVAIIHTNMTKATLLAILRFLYTSELQIHVLCAPELMHYSEKFQLDDLRKKCAQLVTDRVTFDNVIDLFISADFYKVKGLKRACLQVIQTNFTLVSKTEGFSRLLKNPTLLYELYQVLPSDTKINQNTTQHLCEYSNYKQQFEIGKRYAFFGIHGTIRYFGKTKFDAGKNLWIGIEADLPVGHHDGTVDSVKYFDSKPNHGLFIGFWFV